MSKIPLQLMELEILCILDKDLYRAFNLFDLITELGVNQNNKDELDYFISCLNILCNTNLVSAIVGDNKILHTYKINKEGSLIVAITHRVANDEEYRVVLNKRR